MEVTGTLLSGKTTDIDLTPIFYANMITVYDIAKYARTNYGSDYPTPQEHWKNKKITYPIDVSTNVWDHFSYEYGSMAGGYITYDFTKNDKYPRYPGKNDPPYYVDDCVTLFYYTTNTNNTAIDSSVCLCFPPIIYMQVDGVVNGVWQALNKPQIKNSNTTISAKSVTLRTHPYAGSGYSFGENSGNFNVSNVTTYTWKDYSGNCDIDYNPANGIYPSAGNPPSTYTKNAPQFTIGFRKNGLSFFSRNGIKCYNKYATPSTYEGWVELVVYASAYATLSDGDVSYTGYYRVNKLKVRIIKVLLSDDAGEQKFFIGSKYPTEIYLTNSNSTLVPVKEVWLGNVKVWPCGFDFNNPDAKTDADFRFKLKCEGFNFYLSNDPNTKVGNGITDGSVFVSVGFVIEKAGNVASIYNVHEASMNNSESSGTFSSCKVAKYFTSPRPDSEGDVNTRLELTCGSASNEFRIAFDKGDNVFKHTTDNCGANSNCSTFFKNIDPFTQVTLYFYFCCPHPTLPTSTSNYYYSASNVGESAARDIKGNQSFSTKKIKLGPSGTINLYDMVNIYRLASKAMMSEANTIYKGARVNNWKTSPVNSTKIINTYLTDASTNDTDTCAGYLNTIKSGPYFLGGISNSVTTFEFVTNIYVTPKKETNPNNPVNPGTYGPSLYDPRIVAGTCIRHINHYDEQRYQIYGDTNESFAPNNCSGTPHWNWQAQNNSSYVSLCTGEDNLRVGIKLLYPQYSSTSEWGYNKVELYIAKNCHTQSVTETFGGHLWTGNYEQALRIIDYYGKAPTSTWQTGSYDIPSSSTSIFYSRSRSIRSGSYTLLTYNQKSYNDGDIEVNIKITKLYDCGSVTYTAFVGGGPNRGISTAFFIVFNYVYVTTDSVEVNINQKKIPHDYPTQNYKTTVVSGVVSSFGGYSYTSH